MLQRFKIQLQPQAQTCISINIIFKSLNCLNDEELLAIQGAGSREREGLSDPG